MAGDGRKKPGLTVRQLRAISALVQEPRISVAAAKAGVGERTLFRWLNDQAFSDAYRAARGRLLEDVLTSLQAASAEAVKVLRDVMADAGVNAFARVSAAKAVLEMALKAREILDVEERLKALEAGMQANANNASSQMWG